MKNKTALGRKLNWRKRLAHYAVPNFTYDLSVELPGAVDLRSQDTPIFDQGLEGSCTMNAGCSLYDYLKQGVVTSRNFGYWVERAFDGNKGIDVGSSLATCAQVFLMKGVCSEAMWPYGPDTFMRIPPDEAWAEATRHKIKGAMAIVQELTAMKSCLAQGLPFIFGISIYENFEDAENGLIKMPGFFERMMGGHALCCVGYDDSMECFIVRNSWGVEWGENGYCYIPYGYLTNRRLADDFWTFKV